MAAEAMGPLSCDFASWCPVLAGQRAGSSWGQVAAVLSVCSAETSRVTTALLFLQWKVLSKLFTELCFPRHWSLSWGRVCVLVPPRGQGSTGSSAPPVSVCASKGNGSRGLPAVWAHSWDPRGCQHPEGSPPVHGRSDVTSSQAANCCCCGAAHPRKHMAAFELHGTQENQDKINPFWIRKGKVGWLAGWDLWLWHHSRIFPGPRKALWVLLNPRMPQVSPLLLVASKKPHI